MTAPRKFTQSSRLAIAGIAGALLLAGAGFAFAAGGGGGGTTVEKPTCNEGWVYDEETKVCVRKKADLNDTLADKAYALAKSGQYQAALDTLSEIKGPLNAEALNYKGYATRKLGRVDEGVTYYLASVKLDANYSQVREYLGEAYVQLGRVDLAREQLDAIAKICGGTSCENYRDLNAAINASL